MADRSGKLRARAGPRIRAAIPRIDGSDALGPSGIGIVGSLQPARLRLGLDRPEKIAYSIIRDLRSRWSDLIPWTGLRTGSFLNAASWIGGCLVVVAACAAAVLEVMALPWAAGLVSTLIVLGLINFRRPSHRARRLGRQISARLCSGASLDDVADRLMELIEREPRDDAARLLVALYLLQIGENLSALVQLAPLRDRHPDSGEVVLLAALAYVALGRTGDAAALLEVLEVSPEHPWTREIHRLRRSCRPAKVDLRRPAATDSLTPVGTHGDSRAE